MKPPDAQKLKSLISRIIKPATTAECGIEITEDGDTTFIVLHPAQADVAKFIGKGGKNFAALKTIMEYAAPEDRVFRFALFERKDGGRSGSAVTDRARWKPDAVVDALNAYLELIGEPTGVKPERKTGEEWVLITSAAESMPESVYDCLSWWVTVMSLSTGGYAALERYGIATASAA